MKYTVQWDTDAFRRLRQIWMLASEPEVAIRAFDAIEKILSDDAERQGESREGDRRILIVPPLGVIFRARPEVAEVLVLDAWMVRKRHE